MLLAFALGLLVSADSFRIADAQAWYWQALSRTSVEITAVFNNEFQACTLRNANKVAVCQIDARSLFRFCDGSISQSHLKTICQFTLNGMSQAGNQA